MSVTEKMTSPEAVLERENLAYLGDAKGKSEGEWTPKIVAFCCNWCSYAGADLAGNNRASYPAEIKIIRVPCSGRVNPLFILRAFQKGADGVILCGCHPGDCYCSRCSTISALRRAGPGSNGSRHQKAPSSPLR